MRQLNTTVNQVYLLGVMHHKWEDATAHLSELKMHACLSDAWTMESHAMTCMLVISCAF